MNSGFVYFIQDVGNLCVKIGFSKNPFTRISSIQTNIPSQLQIIGIIRGDKALERSLHGKFLEFRRNREWFSKDILTFLDRTEFLNLADLKEELKGTKTTVIKDEIYINENLHYLVDGINMSELARKLQISKSLLADWAAYRREPSSKNMGAVRRLSQYFNVNFEDLFFKKLKD